MNYKSTNVEDLKEMLKKDVVVFEYTKKDGTVRQAKGTLLDEYLPERIPDIVTMDVIAINTLMKEKGIGTMDEYARANSLEFVRTDEDACPPVYVFQPIKRKLKDNIMMYYDVDKDAFRTFVKDNFLGIIE